MSNKLHLSVCHYEQVVAPSGERLRGEGRYGVFAGRTVMHVTTLEIVSRSVTIQMHNFTFFTWMASRRVELIWQFCWSYGASRGFSAVADVLVHVSYVCVYNVWSVECPVPSLRKTGCTLYSMPVASNIDFNKVSASLNTVSKWSRIQSLRQKAGA